MEIKVVKEKENVFFKRKDLELEISHPSAPTPKTDDIAKELASKFSVDESQVVIDYILTKKGLNESIARAKILKEKPVKVEKVEKTEKVENVENAEAETEKKNEEGK